MAYMLLSMKNHSCGTCHTFGILPSTGMTVVIFMIITYVLPAVLVVFQIHKQLLLYSKYNDLCTTILK